MPPSSLRNFDLNLLKVFDAVMAERSLTSAAHQLALTQPAVSNALRRLRETLGDELLVRQGRNLVPTPRAQELWPAVRDTLLRLQTAIAPNVFDPASASTTFVLTMADATAAELAQRHERSEWEVAGLREESNELLDQMTMNATILTGLDTTLHTQIIPPDNDDDDDDNDEPVPNESETAVSRSTDHTTPVTPTPLPVISAADFRHQVQETVAETDWMEDQHRETADKIQSLMQQKHDTVASLGVVLATVQREQLPVQHANTKWHTEAAAMTLHEETQRLRALERKVDQANERCAVLDQECDKLVSIYIYIYIYIYWWKW